MQSIGFIGVGAMGRGVCSCIVQKGYKMTVFDSNNAAKENFRGKADLAENFMDVFKTSEVIFLSLPSSKEVEMMTDEFLKAGVSGKTVVDLSTSYPFSTRIIYGKFKSAGGNFVDAPLNGSPADGENGTFTSIVGGDKEVCEKLKPLFMSFCKRYDYVGASGNGHIVKLAVNYLGLSYVALLAQLFPLMEKMGMDIPYLDKVLRDEPALFNGCYDFYVPKILDRSYEQAFALDLALKDLIYMQKMFNENGSPGFALDGVIDLLRTGVKDGRGSRDYSECAATMREFLKI